LLDNLNSSNQDFDENSGEEPLSAGTDRGQNGLKPLSKDFKNDVPNQSGKDSNAKVDERENIFNGIKLGSCPGHWTE
jgi:hypothetical protein